MPALQRPDAVLPIEHWRPATPARALVLLVHGLGEHPGRYAALATTLNAWGLEVLAPHLRGHGRASGARGDAPERWALLNDLAACFDLARQQAVLAGVARPLVLLGHSLGGLLAARLVAGSLLGEPFGRQPERLVLSSPALDGGLSGGQRLLLGLGKRLFPHLAVANGLQPEWISRDPAVVQAYRNDPLVHDRVSATVARLVAEEGPRVIELAPRWTVPTLLMWGGADRCVAPRGSQAFYDAAPRDVVQGQAFAPLAHEIFNEPERDQVLALLRPWLETL
ncbi:MAG: alpha/beta fold hydrolase [Burkholderiales bacterium]|uniref:alpha/beta fold hydrolase n=1 Tax=Inhella sp. TaxID=1921806 RepID=UPI001AD014A1|nr:alpha/beta fold hydrolase [Burkholderiales bacterium]